MLPAGVAHNAPRHLQPCGAGRVPSVLIELEVVVTAALRQAFPGVEERAMVAPCRDAKFGDYQCNNAMALFAKLKGKVQLPASTMNVNGPNPPGI